MTSDEKTDLAGLDAIVAENDTLGTMRARWRAADAVYKKALLIEECQGDEAALDLYADVVRRLDGSSEPGPRALLLYAMNAVAVTHFCHGRDEESRAMAERVVEGHFDDAPRTRPSRWQTRPSLQQGSGIGRASLIRRSICSSA